jgi:hypothetical protein
MRLRRIARPLARKGLSVIAAFLLSQFPNFRWDLERRVTPVEIAADRNRSIVVVESQKRRFMSVPLNNWLDEFNRKQTRGKGQ